MTSLRDLNCGNDVAMMDKLGRFDREFIVYGCAFWQNGEPFYLVSSRASTLDVFLRQGSARLLYPTSITTALSACAIPAGAQSELARNAKLSLAHTLAHMYRPPFWQFLKQLTALPASDSAVPLLDVRLKQLSGCIRPEPLHLFHGLLDMALAQKTLTLITYQSYCARLTKQLRQMEDDPVIKSVFQRTFSGFGYQLPGERWQYFYDGEPAAVCAKQRQYFSQGLVVTPILSKVYWFDGQSAVQSIAQRFAQALTGWLDADFLALTQDLWRLPPAGKRTLSRAELDTYNEAERTALQGYGYCYRLLAQP